MAQQLRQACATNYPEDFECRLDIPGHITSCAFNSYGSVIAFGTNDGRIFLYDVVAAQIMRQFAGHFYPVTCLSWSRTNRLLLSSGADYQLICWNVYGDELDDALFTLDCLNSSPIINVQFHPRDEKYFLIDRMFHSSQLGRYSASAKRAELTNLMPVRTRSKKSNAVESEAHEAHHKIKSDDNTNMRDQLTSTSSRRGRIPSPPSDSMFDIEEHWACKAVFDRSAKHVYCASDEGLVFVLRFTGDRPQQQSNSKQLVASFRVYNNKGGVVPILQLVLSKSRGHLALNCQDRTIRVFEIDKILKAGLDRKCPSELKPHSEYYDQVNRRPWNNLIFSAGGEFICAAADDTHQIHIWEIESMSLIKTLTPHGRKTNEVLADMQWHPTQPRLLSVANGLGFLWGHRYAEEWSAWNYKFTDLDENQDYEEREGEFDSGDEDATEPISTTSTDKKTGRLVSGSSFQQRQLSKNKSFADEIVDVVGVGDDEPWLKNSSVGNEAPQILVPLQADQLMLPISADQTANASFDSGDGSTTATASSAAGPLMIVPADTMNTDMALLAIYKGEIPHGLFINPFAGTSGAVTTAANTPPKKKSSRNSAQSSTKTSAAASSHAAAAGAEKAARIPSKKVAKSNAATKPPTTAASVSSTSSTVTNSQAALRDQKRVAASSSATVAADSSPISNTPSTNMPGSRKITSSKPSALFTSVEQRTVISSSSSGAVPILPSTRSIAGFVLSPPPGMVAAATAADSTANIPHSSAAILPAAATIATAAGPSKPVPPLKRQDSWPSSPSDDDDEDDVSSDDSGSKASSDESSSEDK